jgi:hypothetical protein
MKKLKKDLQAVSKGLKALAKKTENIIKAVDKFEKAQVKTQAKAKPGKKARAKKPAKKATAQTATDQVVNIIKRSKEGVDVPTLMKKTDLAEKQIRNIVFKASKQSKIRRVGRGVYVGA